MSLARLAPDLDACAGVHVDPVDAPSAAAAMAGGFGSSSPLGRACAAVIAAVDELDAAVRGDAMGCAPDSDIAEALLALVGVGRRIEALRGDVAVRVAGGAVWAAEGFRTPESWVRARTHESGTGSRRAFDDGDAIGLVPLMGAAWRAGVVSRAHVMAVVEAHERFPRLASALSGIESDLVDLATGVDPAWFRRSLLARLHRIDPAAVDEVDSRKRRKDVGLHVSTLIDGFVRVDGLLPAPIGQQLVNSLASARDALQRRHQIEEAAEQAAKELVCTDPGCRTVDPQMWGYCRTCEAALSATGPEWICTRPDCLHSTAPADPVAVCFDCQQAARGTNPNGLSRPQRTLSAINVDALAWVLDAAATLTGAGRLPDIGGMRPVVQIMIDSDSLITHGPSAPGWITSLTGQQITPITARSARTLACDSIRQLLLLDPRGHLDAISATTYTVPPPMRRAITLRDAGRCRFPSCTWAIREIHHIHPWQHGGLTTHDNLVGLCRHHHHLIHDTGWQLTGNPNHQLTFTDPVGRQWQSNPPPRL